MSDELTAIFWLAVYPVFTMLMMGLVLQNHKGGSYSGHIKKICYDLRLLWFYSYVMIGFLAADVVAGRVGSLLLYIAGLIGTALYKYAWQEKSVWYQKNIEPDANARLSMVWLPFAWPLVLPLMIVSTKIATDQASAAPDAI